MGTKLTNLQPGRDGKHTTAVHPGMVSHVSHGQGDHATGHAGKNIATDGAAKHLHPVMVHGGMETRTKGGAVALGGSHKSALDSLSGAATVPGAVTTAPGFGNAGVQSGHPFAKAPGSKNLRPVAPAFGMRSRGPNPDSAMHAIGEAMIAEAFANSGGDDRLAHGRGCDGKKN
jgi:hypothetical protein